MLEALVSIINNIPACDLQAVHYDNEVVTASSGEVITQFDYFTVNTAYGEYIEIHNDDNRYHQLYELFSAQLNNVELDKSCEFMLYPTVD